MYALYGYARASVQTHVHVCKEIYETIFFLEIQVEVNE